MTLIFVGQHPAEFLVLDDGVFLQGGVHFVGQRGAFGRESVLVVQGRDHFGQLAQAFHGEEVGGNQIREHRAVIRGPEHRADEPVGLGQLAVAVAGGRVGGPVGDALKPVGAHALLALLLLEGFHGFDGFCRQAPQNSPGYSVRC